MTLLAKITLSGVIYIVDNEGAAILKGGKCGDLDCTP
jgi:hypothetical protein